MPDPVEERIASALERIANCMETMLAFECDKALADGKDDLCNRMGQSIAEIAALRGDK